MTGSSLLIATALSLRRHPQHPAKRCQFRVCIIIKQIGAAVEHPAASVVGHIVESLPLPRGQAGSANPWIFSTGSTDSRTTCTRATGTTDADIDIRAYAGPSTYAKTSTRIDTSRATDGRGGACIDASGTCVCIDAGAYTVGPAN